jgi:hypothetical protein
VFGLLTLLGLIIFARALSEIASWLQGAVVFAEEEMTGVLHGAGGATAGPKDGDDRMAKVTSIEQPFHEARSHAPCAVEATDGKAGDHREGNRATVVL